MKMHEYQVKELCRGWGLPVPLGRVVVDSAGAAGAIRELGLPLAVKAQILAGGRGKAGGIRLVSSEREAGEAVRSLLDRRLVTGQTGAQGQLVKQLLLERGCRVAAEYYLAFMVDRGAAAFRLIASRAGGVEIEAAAAADSGQVINLLVDPDLGLRPFHFRTIFYGLRLPPELQASFTALLERLFSLALQHDCLLLEINPLAVTEAGDLLILDAKAEIDDNALFRQPELQGRAAEQVDEPLEAEAAGIGLSYIRLRGEVGAMVNGAGLAMATLDLIRQAGGKAANFLDVGGGAEPGKIEQGFGLLFHDPQVRILFVNIFGGILRCDLLAEGLVRAAGATDRRLPMVVRLAGTNAARGREILHRSELEIMVAGDLGEAVEMLREMLAGGSAALPDPDSEENQVPGPDRSV